MNLEEKRNLSEIIKNLVISISIILTGIWAYHSFNERLETETAKARLEKINYELQEKTIINGELKYCVRDYTKNGTWVINIGIHFINDGNTNMVLNFNQESLKISKVIMKNGIISSYSKPLYTGIKSAPPKLQKNGYLIAKNLIMNAKSSGSISSVIEIKEPGIYEISYSATQTKIDNNAASENDPNPLSFLEYLVLDKQSKDKTDDCRA